MDGARVNGGTCELADFFRDVHELQVGLREARDAISNLTRVVQGEQDRASAFETSMKADQALLAKTREDFANLKRTVEQAAFVSRAACQDAAAVRERMDQACSQLKAHDEQLATSHASIRDLDEAMKRSNCCLEEVRGSTARSHERLDGACRDILSHAERLRGCDAAAACLEERLSATDERARSLADAHGETLGGLRELAHSTVRGALAQAEEDRSHLHAIGARAGQLEEHRARIDDHAAQLAETGRAVAGDLQTLQGRLEELAASARLLQDGLAQARGEAKADREQLDDAWRNIRVLQDEQRATFAALRRAREEAAEVRREGTQQVYQLTHLAGDLAALGQGLEVTDGEVSGLGAMLEGIPHRPR